jgi:phosphoglycerate dehydrogenase-like enzyme
MAVITLAGTIAAELRNHVARQLSEEGHDVAVVTAADAKDIAPELLARTEVLCAAGLTCGAELFEAAPDLKVVVTPFLGTDLIDIAAASAHDVLVARGGAPEHYEGMAEATIMLLLAACYDLPTTLAGMDPWNSPGDASRRRMLGGKTVGILGYGAIARTVVTCLSCWDVDLLVHNRTPPTDLPIRARVAEFDELFSSSDMVLILVGLAAETRHLVDRRVLSLMKEDAIIVNTARGPIIDEDALIEWLKEGPARRAALDVFEVEPLPVDSPLRSLPNAILTPHGVGLTRDSQAGIMRFTMQNIRAAASGVAPVSTCNRNIIPRWRDRLEALA